MSFVFSCLFGCLAPKQKPCPQPQSKELDFIQTQLDRIGSHTTACTNSRSTSFGPKQSLNHKLTNLQRTENHIKDMPNSDDDLSKQSLDKLPEDTTKDPSKIHSRSESSKISAQTIQLDYITVDYKPKNSAVITRSLPQFEPERKSRFASGLSGLLNADLKKSQSTKTDNKLAKSTKSQTKIPKPEKKEPKLKMSKSGTLGRKKTTHNKYR